MNPWKVLYRSLLWPLLVLSLTGILLLMAMTEPFTRLNTLIKNWIDRTQGEDPPVYPPWTNDEKEAAEDAEQRLLGGS